MGVFGGFLAGIEVDPADQFRQVALVCQLSYSLQVAAQLLTVFSSMGTPAISISVMHPDRDQTQVKLWDPVVSGV